MLDNGLNALHALPYNIAINFDYFALFCREVTQESV